MAIGIASSEPDQRANGSGHQPHDRAITRRDRRRVILLHHIRRQRAAEHHPGAAAQIDDVDHRQGRQDADRDATEERGLELGWAHGFA